MFLRGPYKFGFIDISWRLACHRSQIFKASRTPEIFRKPFSFFIYLRIAQRTPKIMGPHLKSLNQKLGLTHDTLLEMFKNLICTNSDNFVILKFRNSKVDLKENFVNN